MGSHLNDDGKFQSDKYPTCPAGKVPLSVCDKTAQDLLWEYAQRRRSVDAQFSDDLESALCSAGHSPSSNGFRFAKPSVDGGMLDRVRCELTDEQLRFDSSEALMLYSGAMAEELLAYRSVAFTVRDRMAALEIGLKEACNLARKHIDCDIPCPLMEDRDAVDRLLALAGPDR